MILIGENIHIISKNVREILINKDECGLKDIINLQKNMDYSDLNVGPARGDLENILPWLAEYVKDNSNLKLSLDTTNIDEMEKTLSQLGSVENIFLNSTTSDTVKLEKMIELALSYDCNLVALTMSKALGIPKTADGRLELAFEIYSKCQEMGYDVSKLYFDPLLIPVTADQSQAIESLNTLKILKESFDPPVKTIIGLSNISNGIGKDLRSYFNRVYCALAIGAGLDAVILDAKDEDLYNLIKSFESNSFESETDKLYFNLSRIMSDFIDIEDIEYDNQNEEQVKIIKICEIILNRKIYSNSFAQV